MDIVDDNTIVYHLEQPSVNFLTQMGFWVDIMPKHIYENVDDPLNFQFDGTGYGPYKLGDYKKANTTPSKECPTGRWLMTVKAHTSIRSFSAYTLTPML